MLLSTECMEAWRLCVYAYIYIYIYEYVYIQRCVLTSDSVRSGSRRPRWEGLSRPASCAHMPSRKTCVDRVRVLLLVVLFVPTRQCNEEKKMLGRVSRSSKSGVTQTRQGVSSGVPRFFECLASLWRCSLFCGSPSFLGPRTVRPGPVISVHLSLAFFFPQNAAFRVYREALIRSQLSC